MGKRPSSRPRGLGRFRVSDDYRVPFPGCEQTSVREARYFLTPLGRVYRDDGRLLVPNAKTLRVRLNSGRTKLSLPRAVYLAFGRKTPELGRVWYDDDKTEAAELDGAASWRPWVSPLTPIDELTGRRSCATRYVKLAFVGDLIRLSRGTMTAKQVQTMGIR